MTLQSRIRDYLSKNVLFRDASELDSAASLLNAGVIDSTGAMHLVLFLETEFAIKVADEELVPENLDSIDRIADFVERKSGLRAGR